MAIEPINFDCKGNALGPEKGKFMVRLLWPSWLNELQLFLDKHKAKKPPL